MSIWITLRDATRGASNLLQTLPATMDDEPASRTMAQAHANRERTRSSRHRCGRRAGRCGRLHCSPPPPPSRTCRLAAPSSTRRSSSSPPRSCVTSNRTRRCSRRCSPFQDHPHRLHPRRRPHLHPRALPHRCLHHHHHRCRRLRALHEASVGRRDLSIGRLHRDGRLGLEGARLDHRGGAAGRVVVALEGIDELGLHRLRAEVDDV